MFSEVQIVVDWLFTNISSLASFLWNRCGWAGVCVIGLPLLRKVVDIFRKLF